MTFIPDTEEGSNLPEKPFIPDNESGFIPDTRDDLSGYDKPEDPWIKSEQNYVNKIRTNPSKYQSTNLKKGNYSNRTCHSCNQTGHIVKNCPNRKPITCRICSKEGHKTVECTEPRDFEVNAPHLSSDEAWEKLMTAAVNDDITSFGLYFKSYARALYQGKKPFDLVEFEKHLRDINCNVYLICKEKPIDPVRTVMGMDGRVGLKYVLTFQRSPKPSRPRFANVTWPESPEANINRLPEAGFLIDRCVPYCEICSEIGHVTKHCTKEDTRRHNRIVPKCANCGEEGHYIRNCNRPRVQYDVCRRCREKGHRAAECSNPRSSSFTKCMTCHETGHLARECPKKYKDTSCRNCGDAHLARACDRPRDLSKIQCRNCDEYGHISKECPMPRNYSRITCDVCGNKGHTRVRCPQKDLKSGNETLSKSAPIDNDDWNKPFAPPTSANATVDGNNDISTGNFVPDYDDGGFRPDVGDNDNW